MNIIETHNLNYKSLNNVLFKNINLEIEEGSFTSIIGENGVGKTTLLKILSGSIISDNYVKIDKIIVNKFNIEDIMKITSHIKSYNEFFSKTVIDEILQEKKEVSVYDVNLVKKLLDNFGLLNIGNFSPLKLSYAENQIVALIKVIVKKPKILFLDNAFSRLDEEKRMELLKFIKEYSKQNNLTVISTTNNIKDLSFSDRIILLKDKCISFDGNYEELININLTKQGLKMPWEVEVSNKLMMYDLLDEVHLDLDELVGEICK